ncbi:MAG: hypothetical protein ABJN57_06740 [Hyphomicrobiales bacterium]
MSYETKDITIDEVNYHINQAHKLRSEAVYDAFSHIGHSGTTALSTARDVLSHIHLPKWNKMKADLH